MHEVITFLHLNRCTQKVQPAVGKMIFDVSHVHHCDTGSGQCRFQRLSTRFNDQSTISGILVTSGFCPPSRPVVIAAARPNNRSFFEVGHGV